MAESSIKEKRARRRKRRQDTPAEENDAAAEEIEKGLTEKKDRATPSRRKGEVGQVTQTKSSNPIMRVFNPIREYIEGVRSELDKVTWPTREETLRLTYIVAAATVASALFLGGLSIIFTELFNIGVETPLVFLGVFVVFLVILYGYARFTSDPSNS
jgi:preprotein translocase subunit SecE